MDEKSLRQMAAQLQQPHGEEGVAIGEWMNRGNSQINRDTLEIVNAIANDRILEIGMGNGFFVKDVLQKDKSIHYTGADFSELMVNEAKKNNAKWVANGQAEFIVADMEEMPFAPHSFNKIFTINTIYFWQDTVKICAAIKKVLTPGGKFILALRPKRLMEQYPFTSYGFTLFTKESVADLLLQNDFVLIQAIEKQEPGVERNGQVIPSESLIIECTGK